MKHPSKILPQLRTRTECSFRVASGKIPDVVSCIEAGRAAITDRDGTWGHVRWANACKVAGKIPIFGTELGVVADMELREKQPTNHMSFLARNNSGLREIYELVTLATEKFYFTPRIDYGHLKELSSNIVILSGAHPQWELVPAKLKSFYVELNNLSGPTAPSIAKAMRYKCVATCDNIYPRHQDLPAYEVIVGSQRAMRTSSGHIIGLRDWLEVWRGEEQAVDNAWALAEECQAELPRADILHPEVTKTLRQMCIEGAKKRRINLKLKSYKDRMDMELKLIDTKKFEDYFFVVADMINWAKERMLVGPARGSSCGSLVCYLIGITDIDPLPYDLLFERFIDINREDYPDIDIDFQDNKRELVFDYLREKYGPQQVTRLGTINMFKAKSALGGCAKELLIPKWEVAELSNQIIERSSGDSRAAFCIIDTMESLEIGRKTLAKYPELKLSAEMEGHASHTGMHAAGILVTALPINNYCAVNQQTGTAMLDKADAETLNLLKIDALGLRTLSVLDDTLQQIGWTHEKLLLHPTDDKLAFEVLNQSHFAGIFQFEGYALQSLCKQLPIDRFEDIVSITALARPGPLNSGGATEFLRRRTGKAEVSYLHPLAESITRVTYGVIVYQEQVMQIAREIGALSWKDVSSLRKAMSKSLGKEFFDKYWEKFWQGASEKGIPQEQAQEIWDNINTMGSWAFNRSHAVAYGMMSYWCLVLKAHFPLEFAASCLRNAKDDDQSIKILRELSNEGFTYKPFDAKTSLENWSVQNGSLVGGLTAIKGVGPKLAASMLRKRNDGKKFTPRELRLLEEGTTPWDSVFECEDLWGHIKREPAVYGITSPICTCGSIEINSDGLFVFIGKITEKNLRDHNEFQNLMKRGGRLMSGQTLFIDMTVEDDTGSILVNINRHDYEKWGVPILDAGKLGDWYLWKGTNRAGFRKIRLQRWKRLSGNPEFVKKEDGKLF